MTPVALAEILRKIPWKTVRGAAIRPYGHYAHGGVDSFGRFFMEPDYEAMATAVLAALAPEVERLQREIATGFTVSVADVTNDAATLAECGRLRADLALRDAQLARLREGLQTTLDHIRSIHECPMCAKARTLLAELEKNG